MQTEQVTKARSAIRELRVELGRRPTDKEVRERAGVSSTPVRIAFAREAEAAKPAPEDVTLSASAQQKLEAAIRAHKKQQDIDFNQRVETEVQARLKERVLPEIGERLRKADAILDRQKYQFPLSPAEYKQVLAVLHPDNSASEEKRNAAFTLFTQRADKLRDPTTPGERLMPAMSLDELLKRKQAVDAERKAKRKPATAP